MKHGWAEDLVIEKMQLTHSQARIKVRGAPVFGALERHTTSENNVKLLKKHYCNRQRYKKE